MDKEYVTRDGRAVRVLCVDARRKSDPVCALVREEPNDALFSYTSTGRFYSDKDSEHDLIPKPVKHTRTVWMNVYGDDGRTSTYSEKALADCYGGHARIACKEVTFEFEEGEGL
jgi:hypothetical protein